MVRTQVPFIRAAAQAALEQHILTPVSYDGVVRWINRIDRQRSELSEEQAIRQASAVLIRRLNRSAAVIGG